MSAILSTSARSEADCRALWALASPCSCSWAPNSSRTRGAAKRKTFKLFKGAFGVDEKKDKMRASSLSERGNFSFINLTNLTFFLFFFKVINNFYLSKKLYSNEFKFELSFNAPIFHLHLLIGKAEKVSISWEYFNYLFAQLKTCSVVGFSFLRNNFSVAAEISEESYTHKTDKTDKTEDRTEYRTEEDKFGTPPSRSSDSEEETMEDAKELPDTFIDSW